MISLWVWISRRSRTDHMFTVPGLSWGSFPHGETREGKPCQFCEWYQEQAFWHLGIGNESFLCLSFICFFWNFSMLSPAFAFPLMINFCEWKNIFYQFLNHSVPHQSAGEFLVPISPRFLTDKILLAFSIFLWTGSRCAILIWYYLHLALSDLRQNHWSSDLWLWRKLAQVRALPA